MYSNYKRIILFTFLILCLVVFALFFVPEKFLYSLSSSKSTKFFNLKSKIYNKMNIDINYSNEINIQREFKSNSKDIIIFQKFYNGLIKRHAHATLTGYLGVNRMSNDLPFIFFANGHSFKLKGKMNEDGQYKKLYITKIKNNLSDIVETNFFFQKIPKDRHGIKDVVISSKGEIFIVHTDMNKNKSCTFLQILRAPMPNKEINFERIFKTECINLDYGQKDLVAAHMTGGRMVYDEKNEKIYLSVGMLNNYLLPQDTKNSYGKILEIDLNDMLKTKKNLKNLRGKIIAMGIRNPQGLSLCDQNVFFSSHGPVDGDELNHFYLSGQQIPNFGWPIASYGKHYKASDRSKPPSYAPLYKSHKKYGFKEPLIHYIPSVAPSKVETEGDNEFGCNNGINLWMATMGYKNTPYQKSIIEYKILKENNEPKILQKKVYNINGRVRDIANTKNFLWFFDETNGQLGYLIK